MPAQKPGRHGFQYRPFAASEPFAMNYFHATQALPASPVNKISERICSSFFIHLVKINAVTNAVMPAPEPDQVPFLQPWPEKQQFFPGFDIRELSRVFQQFVHDSPFIQFRLPGQRWRARWS